MNNLFYPIYTVTSIVLFLSILIIVLHILDKNKTCRHRWRVGSHNGIIKGKRIIKNTLNIWCEKCGKRILAYYFPKGF
jgi:DNA-directed RNA polymerase subunit RPC12/RpoP